jgi:ketosteroid isomerase-like protein
MAEEGSGIGDRLSGAVQRIKGGGEDEERQADEAGGRVEIVRKALLAFGEGEHDQFLEVFHEEVEWVGPRGSNFPGAGTHSGRDAVKEEFVGGVGEGFPAFGFRPEHYLDADEQDWVVTLGAFTGEGGAGEFEVPGVVVWEFRDDKVGVVRIYTDTDAYPKPLEEDEREREGEEEEEGEQEGGEEERDEGGKAEEQEDEGPRGSEEGGDREDDGGEDRQDGEDRQEDDRGEDR